MEFTGLNAKQRAKTGIDCRTGWINAARLSPAGDANGDDSDADGPKRNAASALAGGSKGCELHLAGGRATTTADGPPVDNNTPPFSGLDRRRSAWPRERPSRVAGKACQGGAHASRKKVA
eukprot:CAMPEP_0170208176 /NCGR_PEP_ID=MMETSP0116_2-20130129/3670_1 /TAXON_ID=400756 /ORGANISM="Durinskia baltica, Strain CSIRO CS-38" /LENGTH=119 /DNA_ID=CAMNT_0010458643 /DNA_START=1 /DNA_END=358 /DNA_ORIENTATION=-